MDLSQHLYICRVCREDHRQVSPSEPRARLQGDRDLLALPRLCQHSQDHRVLRGGGEVLRGVREDAGRTPARPHREARPPQ